MATLDELFGDFERERLAAMNTPEALEAERIANEATAKRFAEEQARAERYRIEHPEEFEDDEYGCEYCRNDGQLDEDTCPRCDAWYPSESDD